jgi:hypothetical protein
VDISSNNTNLGGNGCANRMPNHSTTDAPTTRLVPFCEDNNDSQLQEALAEVIGAARRVSKAQLIHTGGGAMSDFDGWFGGAKCHIGNNNITGYTHSHAGALSGLNNNDEDRLGHEDYWIEDSCPNPVVLHMTSNATFTAKQTCGCGILVVDDATMDMQQDSFFMWRGLVIWNIKDGNPHDIKLTRSKSTTF